MKLNGNSFVSERHIFGTGKGCFFPSIEIAKKQGCSQNGVGVWTETCEFEGATWYKCGNHNAFD